MVKVYCLKRKKNNPIIDKMKRMKVIEVTEEEEEEMEEVDSVVEEAETDHKLMEETVEVTSNRENNTKKRMMVIITLNPFIINRLRDKTRRKTLLLPITTILIFLETILNKIVKIRAHHTLAKCLFDIYISIYQ